MMEKSIKTTMEAKKTEQKIEMATSLIDNFTDGILLYNSDSTEIVYANEFARTILDAQNEDGPLFLNSFCSEEELVKVKDESPVIIRINDTIVKMKSIEAAENLTWVVIKDYSDVNKIEQNLEEIQNLNVQLRKSLMKYEQSSLVITDEKGIIEFAGQETADNCGYEKEYFIGKSIYDLEERNVFYPSVTSLVLASKKEQVVIQATSSTNKTLVAIGMPILNKNGEIEKVISITKDYSEQVKLSSMIAKMEKSIELTEGGNGGLEGVITCNDKMFDIAAMIKMVAPTEVTVLITGETGTGKEVMAKSIHKLSKRKDKPFIKVTCGSLAPNIVESELFGYEAGAFTGANKGGKIGLIESANGGTLFLDEIGELPLEQQVKLLRVLQEKTIVRVGGTEEIQLDLRIVSATNKNLEDQVKNGTFREDLYYRLNVVSIEIPPLMKRVNDIPLLVKHFVQIFNEKYGMNKTVAKSAIKLLCAYDWPGNIRELENTMERLIVSTPSDFIEADALPLKIQNNHMANTDLVNVNSIATLEEVVSEAEKQLLMLAIDKYKTSLKVAEVLKVNQSTISRKIAHYKLK